MLYARPKVPPTRYDSKVVSIDDSAAKHLPGYIRTLALDDPSGTVPGDEPGCFDLVFLQFIKDGFAGRTPKAQSVGISYIYGGFWVANTWRAMGSGNEFHVGPHIMIIGPDQ